MLENGVLYREGSVVKWLFTLVLTCCFLCEAQASGVVVFSSAKRSKVHDASIHNGLVVASVSYSESLKIGEQRWSSNGKGYLLAGFDTSGALKWTRKTPVQVDYVSLTGDGVYVSGEWSEKGDFLGCALPKKREKASFVSLVSRDGRCQWLLELTSSEKVGITDLDAHSDHGVLLVGNVSSAFRMAGQTYEVGSKRSLFAARISPTRKIQWVHVGVGEKGALSGAWVWAADLAANGDAAIGGSLSGGLSWIGARLKSGHYRFEEGDVPKAASFVTVLDAQGGVKWSRVVSSRTLLEGVALGPDGSLFATGNVDGDILKKGDGFGKGFLFSTGSDGSLPNMWLTKMDPAGAVEWLRVQSSPESGQSTAVAVLGNDVVQVGFARRSLTVGAQRVTATGLHPNIFMSLFRPDGTHQETKMYGGKGKSYTHSLDVDGNGGVLGGTFQGTAKIGAVERHGGAPNVTNGFIWIQSP